MRTNPHIQFRNTGRKVRFVTALLLPMAGIFLSSCEETVSGSDIELPYQREIVVQGFLTAGAVDTFLIIQTLSPLEPWSIERGATQDADVKMIVDGEDLPMRYLGQGRWVPDGWVPMEGRSYTIRVESEGDVVTGIANVPAPQNRDVQILIDTVPQGCTSYDWETGEEYTIDLVRLIVSVVAPEDARFQVRYDIVETWEFQGDSSTYRENDVRAWDYEYPGDGTATVVLREFCYYIGPGDNRNQLESLDSIYLRLFEFEPAYTRFYETQWRDGDDEFFGPTGEEPAWNVSGDGFGWFFGRNVTRDTVSFR